MGFNVKITFTGVCGLVPRSDDPDKPDAFCFLLPGGWDDNPFPNPPKHSKIDGTILRRHMAYMYHTTEHLPDTPLNKGAASIWYFDGHRLIVDPTFEDGAPAQPASWGADTSGLGSYKDVSTPGVTDHLLEVSKAVMNPQSDMVAGQVLVKHGVLDAPSETQVWVFDSYLLLNDNDLFDNGPRKRALNYQMTITLTRLSRLKITARKLYAIEPDRVFEFTEGPLEIFIANLCEQNPLRWGKVVGGGVFEGDEDFRWHYELVDDPDALGRQLGNSRCPIPRPVRGSGAGGGLNCFPIRFPAVSFSF